MCALIYLSTYLSLCIYIYIQISIHMRVYIYIYREREREPPAWRARSTPGHATPGPARGPVVARLVPPKT